MARTTGTGIPYTPKSAPSPGLTGRFPNRYRAPTPDNGRPKGQDAALELATGFGVLGLDPQQLTRYSAAVSKKVTNSAEFERDYADGEVICREGESSSEMFVIQSGRVRITKSSNRGEIDLALLDRGNFFGEMSVLEGLPRDATATAVGATRVLVMSTGALLVRLRRDPTFAFELLHRLSGRVRSLNSRLLIALEKATPGAAEEHAAGPAGTMMMYMPEFADREPSG